MLPRSDSPIAPLPFCDRRPRALFIDVWGTLVEIPPRGWCESPSEIRFTHGAPEALFRAQRAGWYLYLIGNADTLARGLQDEPTWRTVHAAVHEELACFGVQARRDYTCTVHPRGKGKNKRDSVYRLPNTGPFQHAAHHDRIAVEESWVIGDSTLELVSGWRAGCHLAAVRTGLALADKSFSVEPGYAAENLAEAVTAIVGASESLRW
jgi:histidinol phosphatase-like enzyme